MASGRVLKAPPCFEKREFGADRTARRRRVLAAFLLGAVISVAGLAALVTSGAAARGPFTAANPVSFFGAAPDTPYQPTYSVAHIGASAYSDDDDRRWRRRERIRLVNDHSHHFTARLGVGNQPVCVRLCDGFFFPLTTAAYDNASQTAACESLCPDAPTEVFYRNGGDKIEDSMSAKGQLYSALPVSLRYRATADNTCSCHRDVVTYAPLGDSTLRRGDAVMTPAGFMVFNGVEGARHGAGDFSALAKSSMPWTQRGAMQAMERVSVDAKRPTLKDWLVSQASLGTLKSAFGPEKHANNDDNKIRLLVWRGGAQD